ncbi:hypothetical protein Cs7R123_48140 [Catellatospora sp. TT07R-123]|uniref:hypothetical protein n=1 Tax=Catellatospora sp. TT07R-123 TaxID=2733863 RepID=UPI001AFF716F|nr:hypothetical protein [Catellatospora sp. TT07R-123]GHJ47472.1 hypothetical protein Cs7R123_48140 [Catellatospora sp. TT07R-123]
MVLERSDQVARRTAGGGRGGRPPVFDPVVYRERNQVERCFNRFKQRRDPAASHSSQP